MPRHAFHDTASKALERYGELLRSQAPHQRLQQAIALSRSVRALAEAGIRHRHSQATEREIQVRLVALLYGPDAAARIFGDSAA